MSASAPSQPAGRTNPRPPLILKGTGVAPGVAIARALLFRHEETPLFRVSLLPQEVPQELARVSEARELTERQLEEIKRRTVEALGEEHGYIFEAQTLMLEDPLLIGRIEEVIREQRVNAEWALKVAVEELVAVFDRLRDDYFRARSSDIFDLTGRLARNLAGVRSTVLTKLERKYILLSENVRPSDSAQLGWSHVAGLAMEAGGRTYHTAIIARSLGIPCVVGVRDLMTRVSHGAPLVIDGSEGIVIVNPDRSILREYRSRGRKFKKLEHKLAHLRNLPAETRDGYRVALQANVEFPEECSTAERNGAEGIGLFRSEWFLTRGRSGFPSEEEQYLVYRRMAEQMKPWSVIVRAFDLSPEQLGDDTGDSEVNPALGLRAIRLLLRHRDLFKEQLRALLRARARGNVKVMLPMVSGVGELRQALSVLEDAKRELRRDGLEFNEDLPCGVTVEVPSAAATADLLAKEAAFFSIGTNDLIQYLLGVDRANDLVSYLYEPFHPAILRTLKFVIDSAHAAGIKVGVCGEMAADPLIVAFLVGLGIDELSMNVVSIPMAKHVIRQLSAEEARTVADEVLRLATVSDVSSFLRERLGGFAPTE
ncbi:MAG TPA: phosphoenolpyruvate--protein phosphotransferase [Vicinamibacteria bacterium]|nr:phosphoenolpyruvate--protein phosphotransferase [Vicinamibacteria bacterium]